MILRETILVTQMELFSDKDQWQEVKAFYLAKAELNHFITELEAGRIPNEPHKVLPSVGEKEEPNEFNELESKPAINLLRELNEHLRGKQNRPFPLKEEGE